MKCFLPRAEWTYISRYICWHLPNYENFFLPISASFIEMSFFLLLLAFVLWIRKAIPGESPYSLETRRKVRPSIVHLSNGRRKWTLKVGIRYLCWFSMEDAVAFSSWSWFIFERVLLPSFWDESQECTTCLMFQDWHTMLMLSCTCLYS